MTASRDPRDDFVGQLGALLAQSLGGFEEQMATQLEEQIRTEYGGQEVYIHREGWFDRAQRDAHIRADKRAGRSLRWLAARYCLSKSAIQLIVQAEDRQT